MSDVLLQDSHLGKPVPFSRDKRQLNGNGYYCYGSSCYGNTNYLTGSSVICYAGRCATTNVNYNTDNGVGCFNSLCYNQPTNQICYSGICCDPTVGYQTPGYGGLLCVGGSCFLVNSTSTPNNGPCNTTQITSGGYVGSGTGCVGATCFYNSVGKR